MKRRDVLLGAAGAAAAAAGVFRRAGAQIAPQGGKPT